MIDMPNPWYASTAQGTGEPNGDVRRTDQFARGERSRGRNTAWLRGDFRRLTRQLTPQASGGASRALGPGAMPSRRCPACGPSSGWLTSQFVPPQPGKRRRRVPAMANQHRRAKPAPRWEDRMRYQLSYSERPVEHTVWVATGLSAKTELETHSQRLRSWAMIMGIKLAGHAFVRFDTPEAGTVHLPTVVSATPRTDLETGVNAAEAPAASLVEVADVAFADIGAVAAELGRTFDTGAMPVVEYVRADHGFDPGTL